MFQEIFLKFNSIFLIFSKFLKFYFCEKVQKPAYLGKFLCKFYFKKVNLIFFIYLKTSVVLKCFCPFYWLWLFI